MLLPHESLYSQTGFCKPGKRLQCGPTYLPSTTAKHCRGIILLPHALCIQVIIFKLLTGAVMGSRKASKLTRYKVCFLNAKSTANPNYFKYIYIAYNMFLFRKPEKKAKNQMSNCKIIHTVISPPFKQNLLALLLSLICLAPM